MIINSQLIASLANVIVQIEIELEKTSIKNHTPSKQSLLYLQDCAKRELKSAMRGEEYGSSEIRN